MQTITDEVTLKAWIYPTSTSDANGAGIIVKAYRSPYGLMTFNGSQICIYDGGAAAILEQYLRFGILLGIPEPWTYIHSYINWTGEYCDCILNRSLKKLIAAYTGAP